MKKQHNVVIFKYSTIISFAMERFLNDFEEYIVHENGCVFPFSRKYETKFLIDVFGDYVKSFFEESDLYPYGAMKTLVVGTGYCHHSWLYKHRTELTNEKSLRILKSRIPIRYVFSDRLYICDESFLNSVFDVILTSFIKQKNAAFTKNNTVVQWFFGKNLSEMDLSKIIANENSDVTVFPTNKHDILVDLNSIVYKDLRKKHYMPSDIKNNALHMYDLLNIKDDDFI